MKNVIVNGRKRVGVKVVLRLIIQSKGVLYWEGWGKPLPNLIPTKADSAFQNLETLTRNAD